MLTGKKELLDVLFPAQGFARQPGSNTAHGSFNKLPRSSLHGAFFSLVLTPRGPVEILLYTLEAQTPKR